MRWGQRRVTVSGRRVHERGRIGGKFQFLWSNEEDQRWVFVHLDQLFTEGIATEFTPVGFLAIYDGFACRYLNNILTELCSCLSRIGN